MDVFSKPPKWLNQYWQFSIGLLASSIRRRESRDNFEQDHKTTDDLFT